MKDIVAYERLCDFARNNQPVLCLDFLTVHRYVESVGKEKVTPLMLASMHGHIAVMHILLSHGANVHTKSANGFDALIFAARANQEKALELLMKNGAKYNHHPELTETVIAMLENAHLKELAANMPDSIIGTHYGERAKSAKRMRL